MDVPAVDLSQAPRQLSEWVEEAVRAGEVALTRDGEVVARIVPVQRVEPGLEPRRPGSHQGQVQMADDFDALPEEFEDYV